jgi:hypothetical protein
MSASASAWSKRAFRKRAEDGSPVEQHGYGVARCRHAVGPRAGGGRTASTLARRSGKVFGPMPKSAIRKQCCLCRAALCQSPAARAARLLPSQETAGFLPEAAWRADVGRPAKVGSFHRSGWWHGFQGSIDRREGSIERRLERMVYRQGVGRGECQRGRVDGLGLRGAPSYQHCKGRQREGKRCPDTGRSDLDVIRISTGTVFCHLKPPLFSLFVEVACRLHYPFKPIVKI